MNDEILRLAHDLNFLVIKQGVASLTEAHLETFYRAAYNKGIEDCIAICNAHDQHQVPVKTNYGKAKWQGSFVNVLQELEMK